MTSMIDERNSDLTQNMTIFGQEKTTENTKKGNVESKHDMNSPVVPSHEENIINGGDCGDESTIP